MKMWRHSVLKDENLDPLVELLIFAFEQEVPLLQVFFLALLSCFSSLLPGLPFLVASFSLAT